MAAIPPDRPATPAPMSAGVLGMARTTTEPGGMTASSRADEIPATMDRTRRRPVGGQGEQHRLGHVGFHGQDDVLGPDRSGHHRQSRVGRLQAVPLGGVGLADDQVTDRRPPRIQQSGEQGGAHLSAADQEKLGCHAGTLPARP